MLLGTESCHALLWKIQWVGNGEGGERVRSGAAGSKGSHSTHRFQSVVVASTLARWVRCNTTTSPLMRVSGKLGDPAGSSAACREQGQLGVAAWRC